MQEKSDNIREAWSDENWIGFIEIFIYSHVLVQ